MNPETGKYIILAGVGLVLTGLVVYFFHDRLRWIGRLPGDIRIEREGMRVYIPITTMILFSALLSFIVWLIRKFF